jgi:hypothetical protein
VVAERTGSHIEVTTLRWSLWQPEASWRITTKTSIDCWFRKRLSGPMKVSRKNSRGRVGNLCSTAADMQKPFSFLVSLTRQCHPLCSLPMTFDVRPDPLTCSYNVYHTALDVHCHHQWTTGDLRPYVSAISAGTLITMLSRTA